MCKKKVFHLCLMIALMSAATLFVSGVEPTRVHAQEPTPMADHGSCIKCHEDLYFLHDTGNWFCIHESRMHCVDYHGGDSTSLKQEEAHANRKAHPIINEDISKCQECHPAQCAERVAKLDQVAGISEVLVAGSYQPTLVPVAEQPAVASTTESAIYPNWISAMEFITPVFLIGLVLVIYIVHHRHQTKTDKKEK
jgi:hypothetical protein